jgi:predicted nucleotidyltransferase
MIHCQQFLVNWNDTCRRYSQLERILGTCNFMRAMELETTKRYGFSRQQALTLDRREYALHLIETFEVTYEAATGEAIKLMPEDSRRQFLNAMAGFL